MAELSTLQYSCQTYSWQMSMSKYRGRIEHMVKTAAEAGFTGFEPELVMLGDDWSLGAFKDVLDAHGMSLAALVLVEPWQGSTETEQERIDADLVISTVAAMPGSKVVLCPLPGQDRTDLRQRQISTMGCMEAVARRAADAGVACTFHPNSPQGSLFRNEADYQVMAELLPELIAYTPDLGHIAKGGMDPLTVVRQWRDRVDHLHVKDLATDGTWAETGAGTVDVRGVLDYLVETGYTGWVTFEDESRQAGHDPDTATQSNGDYVRGLTEAVAEVAR